MRIKAQAFPYRDGLDIEPMLQWLHDHEFIRRYAVSDRRYIQILKFKQHQSPHIKEAPSTIPAPCENGANTGVAALTPSSLTPDSGLLTADSGAPDDAPPPNRSMTPAGEMAVALRDLGVEVRSTDPVLLQWLADGFTTRQATEAVGIARIRKPWPEVIPGRYIDPILRQPLKPPQKRLGKFEQAKAALGETHDHGFG
jgi:hypothetical protein